MNIKTELPAREMRKALSDIDHYEKVVSKDIQGQVGRSTFRIGAGARQRAKGSLRQAISEKVSKMMGVISVNKNYAIHVERGTRPHIIRPRFKKALAFKPGGGFRFWDESGRVVVKWVKHPGTKAQPFLVPAVEEEAPRFAKGIKNIIEKAAKR